MYDCIPCQVSSCVRTRLFRQNSNQTLILILSSYHDNDRALTHFRFRKTGRNLEGN